MEKKANETNLVTITDKESNTQILKDVSSNFIGSLSGGMLSYGMGYMLLDQTGLAMSFGVDMMITPIIGLLFLIPVGNLTDRFPHKKILNYSIFARLIALVVFAAVIDFFQGIYKLIPVAIFLTIDAITVNFSNTSYSASVHELVNDSNIKKLGSLTQASISLSLILSPAIGAGLYSVVGFDAFIYIEIFATTLTLFILQTMHFHYSNKIKTVESKISLQTFKEGVNYVKKRALLKYVIIIAVVINFVFTALSIGVPFVIKVQLKLGTAPVGYLQTGMAIGMLLGSLLMIALPDKKWFAQKLLIPLFLFGVEFVLLGCIFFNVKNITYLILLGTSNMLLLGLTLSVLNVTFQVRLQETTPTHILGRVMSILSTANSSIMPLGTLFYTIFFQNNLAGGYIFIFSGITMLVYTTLLFPKLLKAIKSDDDLNKI